MNFAVRNLTMAVSAALLVGSVVATPALAKKEKYEKTVESFQRIAVFPVFENSDIANETVAEIVDVSKDGNTLVYTDSQLEKAGFVNITDPANPVAAGIVDLPGEPTSVAVAGDYALVAVNTSVDFVNTSGELLVIDVATHDVVTTLPLGGQPDSVAVSPDGRYAAVVIENERDEDLGDGEPPQAPSGFLVIVDLVGDPLNWTTRSVNLDGVADLFPEDAEPEYVDINKANKAVVTFQENNHIAIVNLVNGKVIRDFPAGTVNLKKVDTIENDLIELNSRLTAVPREPDGVTWISSSKFVTADEGDLFGGSRGFTVYNKTGKVKYSSGNKLEHIVTRLGHYPEGRSENKGNEPENADYAVYGKREKKHKYKYKHKNERQMLFVASERSSVIFVYEIDASGKKPVLQQVLPAGVGPEGVKAIPSRNLLVAASEEDARDDGIRSVINIYQLSKGAPNYPTVISTDRKDGTPIPWAALSGLAVDAADGNTVYTIHDSFYQQSRIYAMDVSRHPAVIKDEIVLKAGNLTVNLDPEGIAVSASNDGSFWVASEGAGSVDDPDRPVTSNSVVVHAESDGNIIETVSLPDSVNNKQRRFGFEGIASVMEDGDEILYVAFQRAWVGDPAPNNVDDGGKVRIGRYNTASDSDEWTFAYYPLDVRESPNGGWVGLSEITALGNGEFAVVERDNQANADARIKKVYKFSVDGVTFNEDDQAFETVTKTLVDDLMNDLQAPNGQVLEKVEGLTVLPDGTTLVVNDNDGVDDSNGETQLLRIDDLF